MQISLKNITVLNKYPVYSLFCILSLVVLIAITWGGSGSELIGVMFGYFFILTCVFSGRWYMQQLITKRNTTQPTIYAFALILVLSAVLGWCGIIFSVQYQFKSEVLIVTIPVVCLLGGIGMIISKRRHVTRTSEAIAVNNSAENSSNIIDHTFIKSEGRFYKVLFHDLLYAEASRNNTKLIIENRTLVTTVSFSGFEKTLPAEQFIRVHRSFIINKSKITHIEGNRVFINKLEIPIGDSFKAQLFQSINVPLN